jgi:hypothetical protein
MSVRDILPPKYIEVKVFDGKNEYIDRLDYVDENGNSYFEETTNVTHWKELDTSVFESFQCCGELY